MKNKLERKLVMLQTHINKESSSGKHEKNYNYNLNLNDSNTLAPFLTNINLLKN